jgi:hypothetical protein
MEPTTPKTGTKGARQTAEGQSMSPQTNITQATNRAKTNRGTAKEGASFSGPANQAGRQQTERGNSNSS